MDQENLTKTFTEEIQHLENEMRESEASVFGLIENAVKTMQAMAQRIKTLEELATRETDFTETLRRIESVQEKIVVSLSNLANVQTRDAKFAHENFCDVGDQVQALVEVLMDKPTRLEGFFQKPLNPSRYYDRLALKRRGGK